MLRIFPIILIFMIVFLTSRAVSFIEYLDKNYKYLVISNTQAQPDTNANSSSTPPSSTTDSTTQDKTTANEKEKEVDGDVKNQEDKNKSIQDEISQIKPKDRSANEVASEADRKDEKKSKDENREITSLEPAIYGAQKCNEFDVEILSSLKKRREELDKWEHEIITKENILRTMELKIDKKLTELTDLKKEVTELLFTYSKNEDEKIKNLVKIYENMKAEDAARIFEELDMDTIINVIREMKEAKAAAIISKIKPKIAKDITMYLANQKKLSPAKDLYNK